MIKVGSYFLTMESANALAFSLSP
eukprot:SAG31_NODE_42095_length_273_cov_0.591954_1_plen_23_part_10